MSNWFTKLQNILPHHSLSRLTGKVATSKTPWVRQQFIRQFAKAYDINLDEAEADSFDEFRTFNEFFTRALKDNARPIDPELQAVVSPADGAISQMGQIDHDLLLQAKGHRYSLSSLAGPLAQGLTNGTFCTIYLAPNDYHRVHLPFTGMLSDTLAIPGALFSVNARTEAGIPGLFARNERLVCRFETEFGPMLVILVGAMIVASIATDWPGPLSPFTEQEQTTYSLHYEKGDEIGRFLLGAGTLFIIGSAINNSNRNKNHGTVTRRHDRDTYTHVQPRRKVVPSACLRKNRSDHGPRRYFSRHCLRKNMANFHRVPDHCARNVWTKRGKRIGYAARCMRNNGWVFG